MTEARIRLDKWLWVARFARSRTLAQEMCEKGRIRLNGNRVNKPGREIRPGDVLTLPAMRDVIVLRVLGSAERRGPATEARALYEIVEE
jgi:ribosome-associated heat shock protein Hsp15